MMLRGGPCSFRRRAGKELFHLSILRKPEHVAESWTYDVIRAYVRYVRLITARFREIGIELCNERWVRVFPSVKGEGFNGSQS